MSRTSEVRESIVEVLKSEKKPLGISEIRKAAKRRKLFVGANGGVTGNAMRDPKTRELFREFRQDSVTRKYTLRGSGTSQSLKPARSNDYGERDRARGASVPRKGIRDKIIEILRSESRSMGIGDIIDAAAQRRMFVGANPGVVGNAIRDPHTRELLPEFRQDATTKKYTLRGRGEPRQPKAALRDDFDEGGIVLPNLGAFHHMLLVPNSERKERNRAPSRAGIYFLHDDHYRVIYVGMSESNRDGIRGRLRTHQQPSTPNEGQKVKYSYFSYVLIPDDLIDSLEKLLIGVFNPMKNTKGRTI